MVAEKPGPPSQEAAKAGRGVLYIAFAKFYFMVAGAIIEFRLPAILTNTVFGAYAVVASAVSPLNNVLITGTIQGVSRFVAQSPERAREIQRAGFRMHLCVGLPIAAVFIAASPLLARFFRDTSKTGPLMVAGLIIAGYSIYAVFVGTANGRQEFRKQASLDITMATLRAVGILGLSAAGFGLYGAISGWVIAVFVILIVSSFVVGIPGRRKRSESATPLFGFFFQVAFYLILLNLIMFADQLLIKRMTTASFAFRYDELRAIFSGTVPTWFAPMIDKVFDPSMAADGQVGYYRAVQNLARLSYQAIIAVTFVIFPLISRTTFTQEEDATQRYIRTTMRYSLIAAAAIGTVFAANPTSLLSIPYRSDYVFFGAPALSVLAFGNVAFCLFAIAGTILNGAGRTKDAIASAGVTLVLAVIANAIVIPQYGIGRDMLLAAATATSGAMLVGAIFSGWLIYRVLGAFLPVMTVIRVVVAVCGAIAVGRFVSLSGVLMSALEAILVGIAFVAILIATRELTLSDLRAVLRLRRSKGVG